VDHRQAAAIAAALSALLLGGCSSADTTSGVAVATTPTAPSATPSPSPDAASAFVDLAAHDRLKLTSAFQGVVAACPFATADGRVIAPADLAPCGPALDHLVVVAQSFHADVAGAIVPSRYSVQAATMLDGLQSLLSAITAYRPVSGTRDLATVGGPGTGVGIAESQVVRAFSG
jgi:hypothetical protein